MDIEKQKQKMAESYQLPPLLAERLRGETAEELENDARFLASYIAPDIPEFIAPLKDLEPSKGKDPWAAVLDHL